MLSQQLTPSGYYSTQLKKPLQLGTPNAQPTTYPVKLRDSWPQNEKPGPPGKKPTHQTFDDYLTKQAVNSNPHKMKCGTHPLLPSFQILQDTTILFGDQSNPRKNPKHHFLLYANIRDARDHGPRAIKKKLNSSPDIYPKYSLRITTIRTKKWCRP
jgi:hypothetical protein